MTIYLYVYFIENISVCLIVFPFLKRQIKQGLQRFALRLTR
jgi:hypothetical protein